jgi:hypothetical protein
MSERVFTVQGQLPIPVGHAVELVFVGVRTGLFSSALSKDEYKPLVRDLVAGVVYGRQFHFTNDDALPATEVPLAPRADLPIVERVTGRVRAARIFWGKLPDHGSGDWVTTLVVAMQ